MDGEGNVTARAYSEISQHFPRPGWVEHDAGEIYATTLSLMKRALRESGIQPGMIAAIGIANQRETTVIWDRETGEPIHNAIVWQCRRTSNICQELVRDGRADVIHRKTGLPVDAYFSASKIMWLLEHVPDARNRAEQGRLAFGTVDSWLIWNLTGGRVHATDFTNASRTMLFNIETLQWDRELLEVMNIPAVILPEVKGSSEVFGYTAEGLLGKGRIPVAGIAGDQQAALFGQLCLQPGETKCTYGTGSFIITNIGHRALISHRGLLTTIACAPEGKPVYALEGSIFIAGALIQWLRDQLGLIHDAAQSEARAREVDDTLGVYIVPAFVGLGAPYWDMDARGAIIGLTRGVDSRHIIRAALEAIAYQNADVIRTIEEETGIPVPVLRVDGGASQNDFLMQFQSDITGCRVDRPCHVETTALGASYLAGLATKIWTMDDIRLFRRTDRIFYPDMGAPQRNIRLRGWHDAVKKVLTKRIDSAEDTPTKGQTIS
jgi:glycerol kinase